MVEVNHAKEFSELTLRTWLWIVPDGMDLLLEGADSIRINLMSQKVQVGNSEHTLCQIVDDAVLAEAH